MVVEGAIRRSKLDESSFSGYERAVFDPRTMKRGRLDTLLAGANVHLRDGEISSVFARILRLDEYVVARVRARTGHIVWRPSARSGTCGPCWRRHWPTRTGRSRRCPC